MKKRSVMSPETRAKMAASAKARWQKAKAAPPENSQPEGEDGHSPPPLSNSNSNPVRRVFPRHACTKCGWKGADLTFLDAIRIHTEERPDCHPPCLVQPTEKFLKQQIVKKLQNNKRFDVFKEI